MRVLEPVRQASADQDKLAEPRQKRSKLRLLLLPIAGFFIFALGFSVGNGNLKLAGISGTQNSAELDYSSVDQLYEILSEDFDGDLDKQKLLDGVKTGLVGATGDPYTEYFNPQQAREFQDALSGSFSGIGAELGTNEEGNIVIVAPLSGYPAEKAGLKPQDIIVAIDDDTTSGLTISGAVRKIRGPVGSKVTLTIIRGTAKPFDVVITRQQITLASVEYTVEGNIGYLKINQFSADTADLAAQAATNFKTQGARGIILDLRGNPGGYLDAAVEISGMWLDKGKPVVEERREGKVKGIKYSKGNSLFKGIPTVILIDGGSASASEIVAGALRDHGVATLVGQKSFGKGSVQEVEELPGGAELKVTIARWYTPKGKNIDKQGISPELSVEISDEDSQAGRDPQKDRATQLLGEKIR